MFERYKVNIRLENMGEEGQRRLSSSSLLIVGAGALGGTAAMYAAASGIGKILIADFDTVDISNLQRQVFFRTKDKGLNKASLIAESIRELNPGVEVEVIPERFDEENADEIVKNADFIIDAADNPATTYLIEKTAMESGKPYVTAGVAGYHAQIFTHLPGDLNFTDLFPPVSSEEYVLPSRREGVFGPLTGMVASIQAGEAVKYLSGCAPTLSGNLLLIDLAKNLFQKLKVES